MAERILRMGVAGLGRAFTLMLPTLIADQRIALMAAADPRPEARQRFMSQRGGRGHESVEALCADPEVELVYIARPRIRLRLAGSLVAAMCVVFAPSPARGTPTAGRKAPTPRCSASTTAPLPRSFTTGMRISMATNGAGASVRWDSPSRPAITAA